MTPTELRALFRADVFDAEAPYLWSDTEVSAYIDKAEEMFCRLTDGIQDSSSTLAQLSLTSGQPWVNYSPKILRIVRATLRSTGQVLRVLNPPELDDNAKLWGPAGIGLAGRVVALVTGLDDAKIRVVQVPTASDTVDMTVERLPAQSAVTANVFEIPAQHHLALLHYIRHLAYQKQDTETLDKKKSDDELQRFANYCAQAKHEKDRRKQKPRLVQYGGIGGGPVPTTTGWPWRSNW